jgi:hypothetical protein
VAAFFKVDRRHDDKINSSPEVDHVLFCHVFDLVLVFLNFFILFTFRNIRLLLSSKLPLCFTKNLFLDLIPLSLSVCVIRVIFENIELFHSMSFTASVFVIQTDFMSYLVIFFDEIKFFHNASIIFEFVLPDFKQFFNNILASFIDLSVLQNSSESLENGIDSSWSNLC